MNFDQAIHFINAPGLPIVCRVKAKEAKQEEKLMTIDIGIEKEDRVEIAAGLSR